MTTEQSPTEVTFTFGINGERPNFAAVADTLRDLERILNDVAAHIAGSTTHVEWTWPVPPWAELTATVNGVSHEQLSRIAEETYRGFEAAQTTEHRVAWPSSFGKSAKRSAKNILKRLEELESLTVKAEQQPELRIESANLDQLVIGKTRLLVASSSVEGRLESIIKSGVSKFRCVLEESYSRNRVQCFFTGQRALDEVFRVFTAQRVMLEGKVAYRSNGTAQRITDVRRITVREEGRPLEEFVGGAPDITGGMPSDELIRRLRDG